MGIESRPRRKHRSPRNPIYYRTLLQDLAQKLNKLEVKPYIRSILKRVIMNMSSMANRSVFRQLMKHLQSIGYYDSKQLKGFTREIVQLLADGDIAKSTHKPNFDQFFTKQQLEQLGLLAYTNDRMSRLRLLASLDDRDTRPRNTEPRGQEPRQNEETFRQIPIIGNVFRQRLLPTWRLGDQSPVRLIQGRIERIQFPELNSDDS